ncbi:hypothetical protein [Flavobacterium granuli]|nr:hypothetical protein [Flavobacterium granuli]
MSDHHPVAGGMLSAVSQMTVHDDASFCRKTYQNILVEQHH